MLRLTKIFCGTERNLVLAVLRLVLLENEQRTVRTYSYVQTYAATVLIRMLKRKQNPES